nr:RT0821/Lpp0805 family surface protein [Caballeronia sordidicola]
MAKRTSRAGWLARLAWNGDIAFVVDRLLCICLQSGLRDCTKTSPDLIWVSFSSAQAVGVPAESLSARSARSVRLSLLNRLLHQRCQLALRISSFARAMGGGRVRAESSTATCFIRQIGRVHRGSGGIRYRDRPGANKQPNDGRVGAEHSSVPIGARSVLSLQRIRMHLLSSMTPYRRGTRIVTLGLLLSYVGSSYSANLGFLMNNPISYMKAPDLQALNHAAGTALRSNADGESSDWSNDGTGNAVHIDGTITPSDTRKTGTRTCRVVSIVAKAKGQTQTWSPTACKEGAGKWQLLKQ